MSLLILDDVKKHFGAQEVLKGASLRIDPGDKVGIVGRNGGGKTTLFNMITGEESPDWGTITRRKNSRLGFVPQRPHFEAGVTVRSYVEDGLDETRELVAELEAVGLRMAETSGDQLERLMKEHDRLTGRIEELGGWDTERAVETVLSGIGLGSEFWDREARSLSGGERNRVALARVLIGGFDLLLLDEPTNHLDLEGIEWLERYLTEMKGAVLVISHDRRLLERSVDRIVELEFGTLETYPGNYSRYLAMKEERYRDAYRRWEQQQDFLRKEEVFIKKHMGSQRTAEAKGRAKKLTHIERLERPHHDVRRPVIKPPEAARGGERVLHTEALAGGYEDQALFSSADLRVGRGQRIGIVGPNGAGKSTLIKILSSRMSALHGEVVLGHGASCGYYDQDTSHLRDDGTPYSELNRRYPAMTDQEIRSHLALFLFRGGDVEKPVSSLSGGERARVALALLVLEKPSWMALDEPTNHLDLASRTSLEEMLGEYQGAILTISHDRAFLDGVCDFIWEVGNGVVRLHEGNYSSWRAAKDEELQAATDARAARAAQERKAARAQAEAAKTEAKHKGSDPDKASDKKSGGKVRNPYKFEKLEKRIMELEERLGELNAAMASEEIYSNPDKLMDTQFQAAEVERELEIANEEWANWE